ncbi:MAG: hypothetical protein QF510_09030, partial [Rhodospirillales bacterium]|nr:hypothetical protein [Rhodospirillales bacterium]
LRHEGNAVDSTTADLLVDLGAMIEREVALDRLLARFGQRVAHAMAADRAAAWAAFDGDEPARLIEEERGAQAAKAQEAAIGAARFKAGEGRGGAVPGKAPKSEG